MGGFIPNAQAAAKPVTATAKYDKKSGKVVVKGKTSQSIQPSAQISVFNPGTQKLLYSASTDAKRNFNLNLLAATAIPCLVRVEVTDPNNRQVNKLLLNVSGAPASCKTTGLIPAVNGGLNAQKPEADIWRIMPPYFDQEKGGDLAPF
jgi:hypothetical protein